MNKIKAFIQKKYVKFTEFRKKQKHCTDMEMQKMSEYKKIIELIEII